MSHLTGSERARYVQEMFSRIAPRYDLMNRLITGGQDVRWRKMVIRRAALPPGGQLLDLGAGTGDLAAEALRQYPGSRVVAADFTQAMMQVGRTHLAQRGIRPAWTAADALSLPFPAEVFDAVVSGYLMRNVTDLPAALREQWRVLRPGGWMVVLDTTRPTPNLFSPLIALHMRVVIPVLGRLVTGESAAYKYLPQTSQNFLSAEQLAEAMRSAGFQNTGFQRLMFGTNALHWGEKKP